MDTSALVAARDKLNADIGTLLGASSVTQDAIDKITGEVTSVDTDVAVLLNTAPPPALDFTAFDAAVAAFKADTKLTQAAIDVAAGAIVASTV